MLCHGSVSVSVSHHYYWTSAMCTLYRRSARSESDCLRCSLVERHSVNWRREEKVARAYLLVSYYKRPERKGFE